MKKLLFLASAAALLATSCSDDFAPQGKQDLQVEGDAIVTATLNFGEEESGTRTTLGSNYQYYWNQGDQIGVLGAVYGLNLQNVPFIYPNAASSTSGTFVGSAQLVGGEGYFAYYPWTGADNLNAQYGLAGETPNNTTLLSSFQLKNSAIQNFNDNAQASAVWSTQRASGSFAPNAAPAYAYSTANMNGTIAFNFQPVYSYLVFPITSNQSVNVSSIKLSISAAGYDGYNRPLVQPCTISMDGGTTNAQVEWPNQNILVEPGSGGDESITLLCSGNGVALGPSLDPVNFWFVVPAGLSLKGATVTLAVTTKKGDTITRTRTLDTNWSGSGTDNGVTKANNVVWLWQTTGQPFTLNTNSDQYTISTAAQFLEYAYLVTNGIENVYADWKNLTNYSLTDLQNMLYTEDGTYNGDLKTYVYNNGFTGLLVKQGVINGTLDLTPSVIKAYFAQNTLTNIAQQAGYYTNVYANYVYNGKGLANIGGGAPFILGGVKGSVATITGLQTGGTIFANMQNNAGTIQYLNIQGCTAQFKTEIANNNQRAFLAVAPSANATFNSVTVGANNIGTNMASSANSKNIWLFQTLDNANLANWSGVVNNSFVYYAQNLNISTQKPKNSTGTYNYAFDFTAIKGAAYANFVAKNVKYVDGTQDALFVVSGKSEAAAMSTSFNGGRNTSTPYSVVDWYSSSKKNYGTSYWTGTQIESSPYGQYTAEVLAYMLNNNSTVNMTMNVNLNMMGDFITNTSNGTRRTWKVPYGDKWNNSVTLNAGSDGNTGAVWNNISNIYMESENPGQVLTLLGNISYIPKLINISDMTVYVQDEECLVAAVSITLPSTNNTKSNVSVENFNVDIAYGLSADDLGQEGNSKGAVGGLYQNLSLSNIKNVGNQCSYTYGNVTPGYPAGIVCGVFNFNLNDPAALTIPYVGPTNAFGIVNVNVTGNSTRSSFMKVLKANSATTDNWKNWNYYAADNTVSAGYTLYVTDATGQYLKTATNIPTTTENEDGSLTTTYGPGWDASIPWSSISPEVAPYKGYTNY